MQVDELVPGTAGCLQGCNGPSWPESTDDSHSSFRNSSQNGACQQTSAAAVDPRQFPCRGAQDSFELLVAFGRLSQTKLLRISKPVLQERAHCGNMSHGSASRPCFAYPGLSMTSKQREREGERERETEREIHHSVDKPRGSTGPASESEEFTQEPGGPGSESMIRTRKSTELH